MNLNFRTLKPASFFILIALAFGIFVGNLVPDVKRIAVVTALVFCFLVIVSKKRFIFLLFVFICLGVYNIQTHLYPVVGKNHISHFLDLGKYEITGKIVSFTKINAFKSRTLLQCIQLRDSSGKVYNVTGKVNLSLYCTQNHLPIIYDTIVLKSRIRSIRNFKNPGGFDYERHQKLKGIYGTAYADARKIQNLYPVKRTGCKNKVSAKT